MLDFLKWCSFINTIEYFSKSSNPIFSERKNYLIVLLDLLKNPNGGLLPEYPMSTMRYLIVGEKALLNDEKLIEAKKLFREGNDAYSVYLETGWYFNKIDRKWRKRISDESFYFKVDNFTGNGEEKYLLPEGMSYERFKNLINDLHTSKTNVSRAVVDGYNVRLGDVLSFEEAYKLYPELKDIYSVFAVKFKGLNQGEYDFYFSPSIPYSLVLQSNNRHTIDTIKYVAIHEIQHYVQTIEGFGSGGNDSLANLVSAVGGSAVRSFFISLSSFQKKFTEIASLIPIESYQKLIKDLKDNNEFKDYKIRYKNRFINVSAYYNGMLLNLERLTKDIITINQNANSISYYLLTIYSMIEETDEYIEKFVGDNIGEAYIDFFKKSLEQNKKTVLRDTQLANKGWSPQDLYILNFQVYESLIGEVESRFTQQTTHIPKELKNYFEFYTSETIDSDKVNVISNSLLTDEGKNVIAGIETNEGKYIIHLPEQFSNSVTLLHETGHILFDFASEQVYANPDSITSALSNNYENVEEYFCDSFVDYIQRKKIDPALTSDLQDEREITNFTEFDEIFESILYSTTAVNESGILKRLNFVMKILE
jgi:hypothetical protein